MSDFRNYLNEQMKDPEFAAEYESLQPEKEYIRAILAARMELGLTQVELAQRCGIRQSNISRIENGTVSPSIATLQKIAAGMGKRLQIKFI
jgi:predicted transcriptional regulator